MPGPHPSPERVLVIQMRHIGDVLMATPVVRALRREFPEARIDFLAETVPAKILAGNPHVDRVIVRRPGEAVWRGIRLLWRVRRNRYDLVVDYQNQVRTGLLAWFSGAAVTLSYGHTIRRRFYSRAPLPEFSDGYVVRTKLALLRAAGVDAVAAAAADPETLRPELVVSPQARESVARHLAEAGLEGRHPLVSIDPTSRKPSRRWDGFPELADRLAADCGARVVFLWGPGEREQVQAVAARCRRPHALAPPTDLDQLAALLERCDLHVGNDSGPRHMAVARGTPTLTVHLESDPAIWTFPDDRHRAVRLAPPPGTAEAGASPGDAAAEARGLDEVVRAAAGLLSRART